MVADIVRAHPEPPGGVPGLEQALGGPGEARELPGEAGMSEALDGCHAVMLDGAALEERREVLHRELVEAARVGAERLEVEPCQVPTHLPGPWTALGAGWFSTGPPKKPAEPGTVRARGLWDSEAHRARWAHFRACSQHLRPRDCRECGHEELGEPVTGGGFADQAGLFV